MDTLWNFYLGLYFRGNHGSRVWKTQNVNKCIFRTLKQSGTNICSMGCQNSNFKIGLNFFGCSGKYTEQSTHCALQEPSASAQSACAAWFALVNAAAWQHRRTSNLFSSRCSLNSLAPTISRLAAKKHCAKFSFHTRGVKVVASQMVGLDDLPITSSDSDYSVSSGGDENVHELYD